MIRHGQAPFLECSSKGDSRFSAFGARIMGRGGKRIEDIYQGAKVFDGGITNLGWREAKGKVAINQDEVTRLYATLWDEYIQENPDLLEVIKQASGLQDMFGQKNHACQATELWRIRCNALNLDMDGSPPMPTTGDLFSDVKPDCGAQLNPVEPLFDTDGNKHSFIVKTEKEIITLMNGSFVVWDMATGMCKHNGQLGLTIANPPSKNAVERKGFAK